MAPAVDVDAELDDVPESIPADPNVRNYSYAVVDDQVYYRVNSLMNQVKDACRYCRTCKRHGGDPRHGS